MSKRNAIYRNFGLKHQLRKFQHAKDLVTGGHVRGPGGPTDDRIPAMLSNGEYVLPADTVRKVGKQNLDRLRNATHKFKDGGLTEPGNPDHRRAPPTPESPRPGIGDGTASKTTTWPKPIGGGPQLLPVSDKHLQLYYADGGYPDVNDTYMHLRQNEQGMFEPPSSPVAMRNIEQAKTQPYRPYASFPNMPSTAIGGPSAQSAPGAPSANPLDDKYSEYLKANTMPGAQNQRDRNYADLLRNYANTASIHASMHSDPGVGHGWDVTNPALSAQRGLALDTPGYKLRAAHGGEIKHYAEGGFNLDPTALPGAPYAADATGEALAASRLPPSVSGALDNAGSLVRSGVNAVKGLDFPKLRMAGRLAGPAGAALSAAPIAGAALEHGLDSPEFSSSLYHEGVPALAGIAAGVAGGPWLGIPASMAAYAGAKKLVGDDPLAHPAAAKAAALGAPVTDDHLDGARPDEKSQLRGFGMGSIPNLPTVENINSRYDDLRKNFMDSFDGRMTPHHASMLANLEVERGRELDSLGTRAFNMQMAAMSHGLQYQRFMNEQEEQGAKDLDDVAKEQFTKAGKDGKPEVDADGLAGFRQWFALTNAHGGVDARSIYRMPVSQRRQVLSAYLEQYLNMTPDQRSRVGAFDPVQQQRSSNMSDVDLGQYIGLPSTGLGLGDYALSKLPGRGVNDTASGAVVPSLSPRAVGARQRLRDLSGG